MWSISSLLRYALEETATTFMSFSLSYGFSQKEPLCTSFIKILIKDRHKDLLLHPWLFLHDLSTTASGLTVLMVFLTAHLSIELLQCHLLKDQHSRIPAICCHLKIVNHLIGISFLDTYLDVQSNRPSKNVGTFVREGLQIPKEGTNTGKQERQAILIMLITFSTVPHSTTFDFFMLHVAEHAEINISG